MSLVFNENTVEHVLLGTEPRPRTENLGPINTWAIPNTTKDVVSFSDTNTISLNGKGGHYETCYKAFTVSKPGEYEISYNYDLSAINFYGTASDYMHFGMFISTSVPPGGNMSTYANYTAGNCSGYEICGQASQTNVPGSGSASYTVNLEANKMYYLWLPMMDLADDVQTYLKFSDIKLKSLDYTTTNIETSGVFNGEIIWGKQGPTYFTLWETNDPWHNMSAITLNDDLNYYDEYIVYGSANRDNQCNVSTENRYEVNKTAINQGGSYYCGQWNTGSTYFLMNGTELYLSGTSGYIHSSYFMGQNNGSTAWSNGVYNTARQVDVHPYKIVGVKGIY